MARGFTAASTEFLDNASAPVTAVPFTMACWFNSNDVTGNYILMSIANSGSPTNWFLIWILGGDVGDPIEAWARGGGSTGRAATSTGFSADTWHHACGVFTTNTSRDIYLDGGSKGSDTASQTPSGVNTTAIGVVKDSSPSNYMDGLIAECGIWNVALTEPEIASLAAGYSPLLIRPQNLVTYVPLVRDADNDIVGGLSFSVGGTPTIENHTRMIYPYSPQIITAPAPVVAGGRIMSSLANHGGLAGFGGIAGIGGGLAG